MEPSKKAMHSEQIGKRREGKGREEKAGTAMSALMQKCLAVRR